MPDQGSIQVTREMPQICACTACLSKSPSLRMQEEQTDTRANDYYRWYECDCGFAGTKTTLNGNGWDEEKAKADALRLWNEACTDAQALRDANKESKELDLVMMVHRLQRALNGVSPQNKLSIQAKELLTKHGYVIKDHCVR
jgi:hypothetical protein